MLNLPNLEVISVNDTESSFDYYITVQSTKEVDCCQKCGSVRNSAIVKIGKREYIYFDIPIHGRRVIVKAIRQRFKCRECDSVFAEALPDMDDKRNATKRLVKWIEERSMEKTFTSIAEDVGINEKTVRNIFKEYVTKLDRRRKRIIPRVMGIDEIHILGKRRFVITNIEEGTIIEMLPSNDLPSLEKYFGIIDGRVNIEFVTMDMYSPYRTLCRKLIPQAQIVVDKFHVLKAANYAIDMVRKRLRDNLSDTERKNMMHNRFLLLRRNELTPKEIDMVVSWLDTFPSLNHAFTLKESFYDIWDSESRSQAEERFEKWSLLVNNELTQKEFITLAKTVKNWHDEIFSYFDNKYTNALTESLNSRIRHIDRMGRGYSFEVLRAKVILNESLQKEIRPGVQKLRFKQNDFYFMPDPDDYYLELTLGADIYTLSQLLDEDKF